MISASSERHQKDQANQHNPKGATDSACSRRVDHLIRLDVARSVLDCDDGVTYLDREVPSALPRTSDGLQRNGGVTSASRQWTRLRSHGFFSGRAS